MNVYVDVITTIFFCLAMIPINFYALYKLIMGFKVRDDWEYGIPAIGGATSLTGGFLFATNSLNLTLFACSFILLGVALMISPKIFTMAKEFYES